MQSISSHSHPAAAIAKLSLGLILSIVALVALVANAAAATPGTQPPKPPNMTFTLPDALKTTVIVHPPEDPKPVDPKPPVAKPQPSPAPAVDSCTIRGTSGADVLKGTPGRDVICGYRGNDRIQAGGGNDVILPGPGRDSVTAGAGRDNIDARDGSRDRLKGGPGRDKAKIDRRLDRVSSVESGVHAPNRKAHRSFLTDHSSLNAEAVCSDKRNYNMTSSQVTVVNWNDFGYASWLHDNSLSSGHEWVRIQDYLWVWSPAEGQWLYRAQDIPAFAKINANGGVRISEWMLGDGTPTEIGSTWNVQGGYWAVTRSVNWFAPSGTELEQTYGTLYHPLRSDGAGPYDPSLYVQGNMYWCGLA